MASDNSATIISKSKTALVAIANIGKVHDHIPIWRSASEFDAGTMVTINRAKQHRWVTIDHSMITKFATNATDFVTHQVEITLWVPALVDTDYGDDSYAAARALVAAVFAAFRASSVLSTGAGYCGYEEAPEEPTKMEYRKFHGVLFHMAVIVVTPREEVAHV